MESNPQGRLPSHEAILLDTCIVNGGPRNGGPPLPDTDLSQWMPRMEKMVSNLSKQYADSMRTIFNQIDNRLDQHELAFSSWYGSHGTGLQQLHLPKTSWAGVLPSAQSKSSLTSDCLTSTQTEVPLSPHQLVPPSGMRLSEFTVPSQKLKAAPWKFQRFSVVELRKQEDIKLSRMEARTEFDQRFSRPSRVFSFFRVIVTHPLFDSLCAFLLFTNAFFIAVQVDREYNTDQKKTPWLLVMLDCGYAVLFAVELAIRILGFGWFVFFISGCDVAWNIFDSVVVVISIVETIVLVFANGSISALSQISVLRTIRIIRIVRIIRIFRLMRFFRSLRLLVNAILHTVKSCLWTSLLLCMILYMFGVLFAQGAISHLSDTNPEALTMSAQTPLLRKYFGTLPRSIFTCFKSILGGIDWEPAAEALSDLGAFYVAMFVILIIFVYLAVMNVIAGLFLSSAIEQAQADMEEVIHHQKADQKKFARMFGDIFDNIRRHGNTVLSLEDFEAALGQGSMTTLLQAMDVDASDAWTLFKLLDTDASGDVNLEEFIDGCLSLKGNAKSIHIAQQRYESKWVMETVQALGVECEKNFSIIRSFMENIRRNQPGFSIANFDHGMHPSRGKTAPCRVSVPDSGALDKLPCVPQPPSPSASVVQMHHPLAVEEV